MIRIPRAATPQMRVFAITWLSYAALYLTRKNFSVVKSDLHERAGLSIAALGMIDTCFLSFYALGQFVSGFMGDRIGARKVIALGLLGSALASYAFAQCHIAIFFALAFGINGIFQSTGWSNNIKAMEPWFDKESRGKILGLWGTNQQLGGLFGTLLATILLSHFGWQWSFLFPAAIVACVSVLAYFFLLEPASGNPIGEVPTTRLEYSTRRHYQVMLNNPFLWCLSLSYFGLKLIRYSLLFWLPFYFHNTLGISTSMSGYLSISFEIGGIIGSIVVGWISDHIFLFRIRLIVFLFILLALILYLFKELAMNGVVTNCILIGLCGLFVFGPDTLISGACAQDIGGAQMTGSVAGFINGVGSVGAILQGAITTYVSNYWGWPSLFYLFFAISLVSALVLMPWVIMSAPARIDTLESSNF